MIHAHDVENKRAEREALAKKMAEWEAKHGKPVTAGPGERREAGDMSTWRRGEQ